MDTFPVPTQELLRIHEDLEKILHRLSLEFQQDAHGFLTLIEEELKQEKQNESDN